MTRYQIKLADRDLTDLVQEVAEIVVAHVVEAAAIVEPKAEIRHDELLPAVYEACKAVLKKYVQGFHVCGCRPHCDLNTPEAPRGSRVNRYILSLDVPLTEFEKELEVEIIRAVASRTPVKNWKKLLLPVIRNVVEPTLGRYVHFSLTCNRGNYMCEVGVCTEFDPWERAQAAATRP